MEILKRIFEYLDDKVEARFRTEVEDILTEETNEGLKVIGVRLKKGEEIFADQVIIVPGRDGSEWLGDILAKRGLKMINNQVDIGVRVETSDVIM